MFESIYTLLGSSSTTSITIESFLLCSAASIVLGIAIALIYMFKNDYSKNFVVTLAILPIIVQMVIALVNGNIGAGVAVMGVFSLVRFRSIPGSAKDIASVFLAMAVGLATGMGYIGLAVVFTIIVGLVNVAYQLSSFGKPRNLNPEKSLRITIPEDLDYCELFDDVFEKYTSTAELEKVKTTNMGSLFQLEYTVQLKDPKAEKRFLDEIRCKNGNLGITLGRAVQREEL